MEVGPVDGGGVGERERRTLKLALTEWRRRRGVLEAWGWWRRRGRTGGGGGAAPVGRWGLVAAGR